MDNRVDWPAAQYLSVWKAVGTKDGSGKLVKMPVYVNPEGYDVEAEERFKVVAVYENPTEQPVDAWPGFSFSTRRPKPFPDRSISLRPVRRQPTKAQGV